MAIQASSAPPPLGRPACSLRPLEGSKHWFRVLDPLTGCTEFLQGLGVVRFWRSMGLGFRI